jgi:Domain of unknown function (DUF4349)
MTEPAFDDLARKLQAARPEASDELRERVLGLARTEPLQERPRRFRLTSFLVPALGAATVVAFVAVGVTTFRGPGGDPADREAAGGGADVAAAETVASLEAFDSAEEGAADSAAPPAGTRQRSAAQGAPAETLPPSGNRLQEYRADLRVRVADLDELSETTAAAMRIARSLGGYVVSAQLTTPVGSDGDSELVVRVPVTKVQDAIARFSGLGVLVAQDIAIQDLQGQANRQDEQIEALRRTIATLERALEAPDLTPEERADLERRIANADRSLKQAQRARAATERRGSLARVGLTLTTREEGQALPPPPPGDFEQTLRDALGALEQVVAWALAALIVASPFLALTALLVALEARRRRRAEERLLQRA